MIPGQTANKPAISVVIATYNRRSLLEMGLAALEKQTAPAHSFEVVVIDDGSTDDTAAWLARRQFSFTCNTLSQSNQGAASARNGGIDIASGEYVLFLDDDLIAEPQLIAEHLRAHARSPAKVVLGPASSLPYYRQPWVAWQQRTLEKAYRAIANGEISPSFRQFWSGNCSVSRDALAAVGGFNAGFAENEDVELGYRLEKHGLTIEFNAQAQGYHHSTRGFASWGAAHATYGRTDVEILRRSSDHYLHATLRQDWQKRHPLTRMLAGWAAGDGWHYQTTIKTLSALVQAARLAPMSRFSWLTCSALANVLYWNAVRNALGDSWEMVLANDSDQSPQTGT